MLLINAPVVLVFADGLYRLLFDAMSHVIVFNSYARTVKIPTTPVKYLTEVRDEACQKLGVNKDQYTLKYTAGLSAYPGPR